MKKYGIETLKKGLGVILGIVNLVQTIKRRKEEGKKVKLMEWIKLVFNIGPAVTVFYNIDKLKSEYFDLDKQETIELVNYFSNEFDLENNKVEKVIETVFNVIINLSDLLSFFIESKKE